VVILIQYKEINIALAPGVFDIVNVRNLCLDVCLNISRIVESIGFVFNRVFLDMTMMSNLDNYDYLIFDTSVVQSKVYLDHFSNAVDLSQKNLMPKLIIFDNEQEKTPFFSDIREIIEKNNINTYQFQYKEHLKARLSFELIFAIEHVMINFERGTAYLNDVLLLDFKNTMIYQSYQNIKNLNALYFIKSKQLLDDFKTQSTLYDIRQDITKNENYLNGLIKNAKPFRLKKTDPLIIFNEKLKHKVFINENLDDNISLLLYNIDMLFSDIYQFDLKKFENYIKQLQLLFYNKTEKKLVFKQLKPNDLLSMVYEQLNDIKEQIEATNGNTLYVLECNLILSKIAFYIGKEQVAFDHLLQLTLKSIDFTKDKIISEYMVKVNFEIGLVYLSINDCIKASEHFSKVIELSKKCYKKSKECCVIYQCKSLNQLANCKNHTIDERKKYHASACIEGYRLLKSNIIKSYAEINYVFEDALHFYDQEGFSKLYDKLNKWLSKM
jgi:hypothetical protein